MTERRTVPPATRFRVLERCSFRCVYCGTDASRARLEIDHRVSLADGGADHESNLVAACTTCNLGKGRASVGSPEDAADNDEYRARRALPLIEPLVDVMLEDAFDSALNGASNACLFCMHAVRDMEGEDDSHGDDCPLQLVLRARALLRSDLPPATDVDKEPVA